MAVDVWMKPHTTSREQLLVAVRLPLSIIYVVGIRVQFCARIFLFIPNVVSPGAHTLGSHHCLSQ